MCLYTIFRQPERVLGDCHDLPIGKSRNDISVNGIAINGYGHFQAA
ncbi:MAG: hypothetical protein IJ143_03625 [Neisseriaceae bacterium]|nr:hypothetical protein [Neisseriaceae bacterium]